MNTPPRLADCLLRFFCDTESLEEVEGDLHEEFQYQIGRVGERQARWRYWRDVLGFVKSAVIKRNVRNHPKPAPFAMIAHYLKMAWRNSRSQKMHTLINVGGLSVALAATLLIMMWVQNELRFDQDQPNAERLFLIRNQEQTDISQRSILEHSPYPLAASIKQNFPEVEVVSQMARSQKNEVSLNVDGRIFTEEYTVYVDENWFKMFRYNFLRGAPDAFSQHPYSLILTESKAKKMFGTYEVVGRNVQVDSTQYVVRGIISDNPVNSSFQFEVIMPIAATLNTKRRRDDVSTWLYATHRTFVRLRPSANPVSTADKITRLYNANRDNKNLTATLLPLPDLHFANDFKVSAFPHGDRQTLNILTLIAISLLVAACVNYVNLAIARTGIRSKEIGVRKIMGANRGQLFFQIIAECVLVSWVALVFAALLVMASLPAFNAFTDQHFSFNPFESHTAGLLLGSWGVLLLLISIYPALLLSSINPLNLFRGMGLLRMKRSALQQVLIVGQFGMAVIMITETLVVYRQFAFMQQQHNGYQRSQLFTIQVPRERVVIASYEESLAYGKKLDSRLKALKEELREQASVKNVVRLTMESIVNDGYTTSGGLDWEGRKPDHQPEYIAYSADEDLNKTMKFRFVEGRWFNPKLSSDRENVILNETAVKQFGLTAPVVGKRFNNGKIIGVVQDFYHQTMRRKIAPVVIRTNAPNTVAFLVETQAGQAVTALEGALAAFNVRFPAAPLIYTFVDQEFEQLYRTDKKALQFVMLFAGLSVMISCLGLLGMMTLSAEQRMREIGIRKVLGASVSKIVWLLSTDFLRLMAIAMLMASPIAWWAANRWLQNFAYQVNLNGWIIGLAGLLAVGIALLTISVQSVGAALKNPVKSLRSE